MKLTGFFTEHTQKFEYLKTVKMSAVNKFLIGFDSKVLDQKFLFKFYYINLFFYNMNPF